MIASCKVKTIHILCTAVIVQ